MSFEKRWAAIPASAFTANGGTIAAGNAGLVTIASTIGYHEKQQVLITAMGKASLELEVKAVISSTQMYVGSQGAITGRYDLSGFTIIANAQIQAPLQPRPSIPDKEYARAVYEEAPATAIRSILVDDLGDKYNTANPLPVAFDGTVQIGDVSIIGNGNTMGVNSDGSINVNIVTSSDTPGLNIQYAEVDSVVAGVQTTILTFVASSGGFRVFKVDVSGENVAVYTLVLNSSTIALRRTYWGIFNSTFIFDNLTNGLVLNSGDTLTVSVIHERPNSADFEATLYGLAL